MRDRPCCRVLSLANRRRDNITVWNRGVLVCCEEVLIPIGAQHDSAYTRVRRTVRIRRSRSIVFFFFFFFFSNTAKPLAFIVDGYGERKIVHRRSAVVHCWETPCTVTACEERLRNVRNEKTAAEKKLSRRIRTTLCACRKIAVVRYQNRCRVIHVTRACW